jgi:hypothetical protein
MHDDIEQGLEDDVLPIEIEIVIYVDACDLLFLEVPALDLLPEDLGVPYGDRALLPIEGIHDGIHSLY